MYHINNENYGTVEFYKREAEIAYTRYRMIAHAALIGLNHISTDMPLSEEALSAISTDCEQVFLARSEYKDATERLSQEEAKQARLTNTAAAEDGNG